MTGSASTTPPNASAKSMMTGSASTHHQREIDGIDSECCQWNVIVTHDTTPPVLNCPANQTHPTDPGKAYKTPMLAAVTATTALGSPVFGQSWTAGKTKVFLLPANAKAHAPFRLRFPAAPGAVAEVQLYTAGDLGHHVALFPIDSLSSDFANTFSGTLASDFANTFAAFDGDANTGSSFAAADLPAQVSITFSGATWAAGAYYIQGNDGSSSFGLHLNAGGLQQRRPWAVLSPAKAGPPARPSLSSDFANDGDANTGSSFAAADLPAQVPITLSGTLASDFANTFAAFDGDANTGSSFAAANLPTQVSTALASPSAARRGRPGPTPSRTCPSTPLWRTTSWSPL